MRSQGAIPRSVAKKDPELERGHSHLAELPPAEFYAMTVTRAASLAATNEGDIDHHGWEGRGVNLTIPLNIIIFIPFEITLTSYFDNHFETFWEMQGRHGHQGQTDPNSNKL